MLSADMVTLWLTCDDVHGYSGRLGTKNKSMEELNFPGNFDYHEENQETAVAGGYM